VSQPDTIKPAAVEEPVFDSADILDAESYGSAANSYREASYAYEDLDDKLQSLASQIMVLDRDLSTESLEKPEYSAYLVTDILKSREVYELMIGNTNHPVSPEAASLFINQSGIFPIQALCFYLSQYGLSDKLIQKYIIENIFFEGDGIKVQIPAITKEIGQLFIEVFRYINQSYNAYLMFEFSRLYGRTSKGRTFSRCKGKVVHQSMPSFSISRFLQPLLREIESTLKEAPNPTTVGDGQHNIGYLHPNEGTSALSEFKDTEVKTFMHYISCSKIINAVRSTLTYHNFIDSIAEFIPKTSMGRFTKFKEKYAKANSEGKTLMKEQLVSSVINMILSALFSNLDLLLQRITDMSDGSTPPSYYFDGTNIVLKTSNEQTLDAESLMNIFNSVLLDYIGFLPCMNHNINFDVESDHLSIPIGNRILCFYYYNKRGKRVPLLESPDPTNIYPARILHELQQKEKEVLNKKEVYRKLMEYLRLFGNNKQFQYLVEHYRKAGLISNSEHPPDDREN